MSNKIEWVWIYDHKKTVFRKLRKDNLHLDWSWPHTPPGRVKYTPRLGGRKPEWMYVCFHSTPQGVADKANEHLYAKIDGLRQAIARLEASCLTVPEGLK